MPDNEHAFEEIRSNSLLPNFCWEFLSSHKLSSQPPIQGAFYLICQLYGRINTIHACKNIKLIAHVLSTLKPVVLARLPQKITVQARTTEGLAVTPYDLFVGSRVVVLRRKVVLKKAREWIGFVIHA